jgi:hypothetical protein
MISTAFTVAAILAAQDSKLLETLIGFLPIVLFLLILFFVFRRQQKSPVAKLQREYLQQQVELMPRIEALLERIAKALERNQ